MELKFEVEKHGNHSRSFHTNVVVGKTSIEHYAIWLTGSYEDARFTNGWTVANMVRDLLNIPGVESVFVEPYEVSVHLETRNCRPQWNEKIDAVVEDAIKELARLQGFPSGKKVVVKISGKREEFHTNFEISRSVIEHFMRPLRDSSNSYLNKVGFPGSQLVRRIMEQPGVTEIFIHPYEVSVNIAEVFSWTERDDSGKTLEDKIKEDFDQTFGNISYTIK